MEAWTQRSNHRHAARDLLALDRMGVPLRALRADQLGRVVDRRRVCARGSILVAVGVVAGKLAFERARGTTLWIAIALIAIVVAGYPLLAAITGRAWTSAEVFGTAPDPTALVTVAVLSLARGRVKWLLLAIPLLWCAATALTLRALMAPEFSVVIVAALCALAPAFRLSGRARGTT